MEHRVRTGRLSSTRKLLSGSWAAEVEEIERAISRVGDTRRLSSDCEVVFFEIADDTTLHVNVTHQQLTKEIPGWAGPAHTVDGFVHNRTFGAIPTLRIVRHVREMVFAAPR